MKNLRKKLRKWQVGDIPTFRGLVRREESLRKAGRRSE